MSRETVALLSTEIPDFISPLEWPLNRPDLNPMDCEFCGILQVYLCQIRNVDHLKERLIEEWRRYDQNIIDGAVNQWRDRLHCINVSVQKEDMM